MEEFDVSYSLDNEQQFWDELEDILSIDCPTHFLIDNTLRTYLHFTTNFKDEYLRSDYDIARCFQRLLDSPLFQANKDYVRTQIVYGLIQEDDTATLYVIASLLLFVGRHHAGTFELMQTEGCFLRLIELIREPEKGEVLLHRLLLELLYEMSRLQRLRIEDLVLVDDEFIKYLFQIIEELSDDVDDPYHYPVIRVLLVLNEQYMVATTQTSESGVALSPPPTNRVVKVLSTSGSDYMTFGENLILLLNRETETSLQLLILKLLYLLFTTQPTQEYFYTNDLRVLLDVIIRNLLDLPNELVPLRHTYLRVLYPLLAHTQLSRPPHYKRAEILKVVSMLGGSTDAHFAPTDDTTLRLVERVGQIPWLTDQIDSGGEPAKRLLGISLSASQTASSVSVQDVAAVRERPGVQTPSRRAEAEAEAESEAAVEVEAETSASKNDSDKDEKATGVQHTKNWNTPLPVEVPAIRLNGNKKLPPKTPPRRRTRVKVISTSDNAHEP